MAVVVNAASAGLGITGPTASSLPLPIQQKLYHGAWYYPGWKDNPAHPFGPPWTTAWFWKDGYTDRQPKIGWYDESLMRVMDYFITTAASGGIDYFAFCWYYNHTTQQALASHAIDNFFNSSRTGVYGCIAFETENAEVPITNLADLTKAVTLWKPYIAHSKYFRINGKPVVYMVKTNHVNDTITAATGLTHAQILTHIKGVIGEDIYFIACSEALSYWKGVVQSAGYNGWSAYNLFNKWINRDTAVAAPGPQSFGDLFNNYAFEYEFLAKDCNLDLWMPLSTGFDAAPWAASVVGKASLPEWRSHLQHAYGLLNSSPKFKGTVTYAWNEHGEGGWLVPCVTYGTNRLRIFKEIMLGTKAGPFIEATY